MEISVLISVYYKEKPEYLDEALKSIVNQTLKPEQIVIVKDGKLTSELELVLNKYKENYNELIDIYELEKNTGLGYALNFGVEKCRNEYIARMDTDDIAPIYRLEEQAKIMKMNSDLDILGGYIEEYDEKMEEVLSIRKVPLTMEKIKKSIKTQCPFNHGSVMFKKQAIIKSGNYSNVKLEDYDLWARMLKNNCIMANTDIILNKMRTGDELYKRRNGMSYVEKVVEIENKLLEYKIINRFEYIRNIFMRIILALIPVKIKKCIYINIIRKYK